jgi:hypothetical protein
MCLSFFFFKLFSLWTTEKSRSWKCAWNYNRVERERYVYKKKEGDIFKEEEKGPKDRRRSGREGAAPPRSSFEGEKRA